jgi:hypothetical protein
VSLRALLTAGVAVFAYVKFVRPWVLNWGARPEEASRAMAGDELVSDVAVQTTRAITVEARPERIWPWLVQMGPRPRAGVYTYDFIERLLGIDIENADRLMPEHQHMAAGDSWPIGKRGTGIVVRDVQPQRAIVLQWTPALSTWTFGLYPEGESTRLISRNRLPGSGLGFWLIAAIMEPGSLVMERKMLLGIKERAERPATQGASSAAPAT